MATTLLPKLSFLRLLFDLSASARALAPSVLIPLPICQNKRESVKQYHQLQNEHTFTHIKHFTENQLTLQLLPTTTRNVHSPKKYKILDSTETILTF